GDRPRESVIHGLSRIGKVILFAGLIMASVFLAFVTQPDVIAKMFGLGLGLAILIDVTIVRLVIAPAVVTLLGDRASTSARRRSRSPSRSERQKGQALLSGRRVDGAIRSPGVLSRCVRVGYRV